MNERQRSMNAECGFSNGIRKKIWTEMEKEVIVRGINKILNVILA